MVGFLKTVYDWLMRLFWYVGPGTNVQLGRRLADEGCQRRLTLSDQGHRDGRDDDRLAERGKDVAVEGPGGE